MGSCDVGRLFKSLDAGAACGHPERFEESLANKVVPTFAGHTGNDLTSGQIHNVLIPEVRAKTPRRFQISHPPHYLVAIIIRAVPEEVTAFQPTAMTQQVAHGYLASNIRIKKLKSRKVLRCGVVQLNFVLINQHSDGRSRESL